MHKSVAAANSPLAAASVQIVLIVTSQILEICRRCKYIFRFLWSDLPENILVNTSPVDLLVNKTSLKDAPEDPNQHLEGSGWYIFWCVTLRKCTESTNDIENAVDMAFESWKSILLKYETY